MKVFPLKWPLLLLLFCLPYSNLISQSNLLFEQVKSLQQSGTVFVPVVDLFSEKPAFKNPQSDLERNAQRLRLNLNALATISGTRPAALTLSVPYNGQILEVELFQASVLTDNFTVMTGNWEQQPYTAGVYYRGIIKGVGNSLAAISFFDNELIGVIAHPEWGNLNLGRVENQPNLTDYVCYSDVFLPPMPFADCGARETGEPPKPNNPNAAEVTGCVRLFFEADYALFDNKGSVGATVNYVTGFFNVVATLFGNETVSTALSQVYVWTTPDAYSTSSSGDALEQFMAFRTFFDGDLAHLAALGGNGLGGVAYLDVLCSTSFNYGYSNINATFQNFPTYSWTINVVTHELGHNFSSRHTHWCGWPGGAIDDCGPSEGYPNEGGPCANGPTPTNGGTIMSYCHLVNGVGVNFSNGFGQHPGDAIRTATTEAHTATCILATCPTSTCTAPTALTVTAVTINSATIGWTAIGGALSYTLQYRLAGASTWTTVTGAANPYTITGLAASSLYEVQVRSNCSGSSSPYFTGVLFETGSSPCPEPSELGSSPVSGTSVSLSWTENGGATNWDIQYGTTGFVLGAGTTVNTSTEPYTLTGLAAGTIYDFYVRSICGGSLGNSSWVGPYTFSTPFENDLSTNAVLLTVGQPCSGNIYTNEGATISANEFSPTTANGGYWGTVINNTVWFKFVAPASGSVYVNTDISPLGTLEDTQVALYNAESPTGITQHLVSNEDGGLLAPGYAAYAYYSGLTAGSTYYIQVDGYSNDVGTFCIEVTEDFALPAPTTCTAYTQGSVNGSTAPNKWYNIYTKPNGFDIGLPVAAVKSSVNLGTVTVQEIRNTTVPTSPGGVKYMQRYFNFSSTQNSAAAKSIRLFFTDDELEALKTATGLTSNTAEDLNISHYDGTNENCTPNDNNNTGFSVISAVSAQSIGASDFFYLEFVSPSFSEMGAMFGNAALPLDLLSFTADANDANNTIRWTTENETGVLKYVLQRTAHLDGAWQTIFEQKAGGDTYTFEDKVPTAISYYRLRIEEADGRVSYSPIAVVEREQGEGIRNIVPNPASSSIYVEYHASSEVQTIFQIFGSDGRLLLTQHLDLIKGANFIPFDISGLPDGVYYCTTSLGTGQRFVVAH